MFALLVQRQCLSENVFLHTINTSTVQQPSIVIINKSVVEVSVWCLSYIEYFWQPLPALGIQRVNLTIMVGLSKRMEIL